MLGKAAIATPLHASCPKRIGKRKHEPRVVACKVYSDFCLDLADIVALSFESD